MNDDDGVSVHCQSSIVHTCARVTAHLLVFSCEPLCGVSVLAPKVIKSHYFLSLYAVAAAVAVLFLFSSCFLLLFWLEKYNCSRLIAFFSSVVVVVVGLLSVVCARSLGAAVVVVLFSL